ncbi:MAG: hypothetical protein Q7T55_21100, partial [Solirubrobacteraceae bacterium]|nr:hypothetical protein [Solirubrobacteraceae bacterium]
MEPLASPVPGHASTPAPKPAASAAAPQIEWPRGGFQWTDAWRDELPIVRGIKAPPLPSVRSHLSSPVSLADDRYGRSAAIVIDISEALGRKWTFWDEALSTQMIRRDLLLEPDSEYWLELSLQVVSLIERRAELDWISQIGIELHGVAFMLERILTLWQAVRSSRFTDIAYGMRERELPLLRRAIASASDEALAEATAIADRERSRSEADRLVCSYLFPHREDWAVDCVAAKFADTKDLLRGCAMPIDTAIAYLQRKNGYAHYHDRTGVLLQVRRHGEAALPLVAALLAMASDKASTESALELLMAMHVPAMLGLLVDGIENKEVRAALDKAAKTWPAAVLKTAIERSLATRSRTVEGWTVHMALREPEVLAVALAALDDVARGRFEALLHAQHSADAAPEQLPPLLRDPPWAQKTRPQPLPTLEIAPLAVPDAIEWTAEE